MWVTLRKARKLLRHAGKTVGQHVEEVPGSPFSGPSRQRVFFLRGLELKKVRISLQQHELSKVHRCKGAPLWLHDVLIIF